MLLFVSKENYFSLLKQLHKIFACFVNKPSSALWYYFPHLSNSYSTPKTKKSKAVGVNVEGALYRSVHDSLLQVFLSMTSITGPNGEIKTGVLKAQVILATFYLDVFILPFFALIFILSYSTNKKGKPSKLDSNLIALKMKTS
jgi:hypothetical protein